MLTYFLDDLETEAEVNLVKDICEEVYAVLFPDGGPEILINFDQCFSGLGIASTKEQVNMILADYNVDFNPVPDKDQIILNLCEFGDIFENAQFLKMTIAHEMRHMYQYYTGMLSRILYVDKIGGGQYIGWEGQIYRFPQYDNQDEYMALPWELDANKFAVAYAELTPELLRASKRFSLFANYEAKGVNIELKKAESSRVLNFYRDFIKG